jgi:hypothetical protein
MNERDETSPNRPEGERPTAPSRVCGDGRRLYQSHNSPAGGDQGLVGDPTPAIAEQQDSERLGRGDPVTADAPSLEIGELQGQLSTAGSALL